VAEGTALTPTAEVGLAVATDVCDSAILVKVGFGVRVALGVGTGGLDRAQATSSATIRKRLANSNRLVTVLLLLESAAPALASSGVGGLWLGTMGIQRTTRNCCVEWCRAMGLSFYHKGQ